MRNLSGLFILIAFVIASCVSPQDKILRSSDVNYKFTKANELFDAGKWYQANEIYAQLVPIFRGSKNFEELAYRYAYSFYNMKDYLGASYQFKNFVDQFPNSPRAEECEFKYATSLYFNTEKPSLDQTMTYKAIDVLQSYINSNPNSKNLVEATKYVDICRAKIEEKDANAAQLYFDMGEFKAATTAFKALINKYPESKQTDAYQLMVMKSFYNYARNSRITSQEERFAEVINAYTEFTNYYPNSNLLAVASALKEEAQGKINQLRNEHQQQ